MPVSRAWLLDRIRLLKADGTTLIDPATEQKLEAVRALLEEIRDTQGDISIDADQVNLNTDTLEAQLSTLIAQTDGIEGALNISLSALRDALRGASSRDLTTVQTAIEAVTAAVQALPAPQTNALTDAQLRASAVPVTGPLTDAQLRATPVPVSGTVSVTEPVSVDDNGGSLTVDANNLDIRDLTFAADKVDASGSSVAVSNFPATQAVTQSTSPWVVSGTVTATPTGTQDVNVVSTVEVEVKNDSGSPIPVTGPLTDTQLRASAVPVSNTVLSVVGSGAGATAQRVQLADESLAALESITITPSGTQDENLKQVNGVTVNVGTGAAGTGTQRVAVSSDSFPASQAVTGPLTDTQLRASAVPVSGPLTDTQLRASAVPVSAAQSGTWTVQPGNTANTTAWKVDGSAVTQPVSGTVTANAGTGPFPVSDNAGSLTVDAPVGTPVFARLSDGTAALTTSGGRLAVDASGVAVPVTDNAGSLTIDNAALSVVGSGAASTAQRVHLSDESLAALESITVTSAGNADKTEDAGHTTGNIGSFILGVRNDSDAVLTSTDLDYSPLATDSVGRLKIGQVIPGVNASNLGKAEDAAFASGDTGVMALGVRNDTFQGLTSGDLDYGGINIDGQGRVGIRGSCIEDSAHATADTGVFALAVRNDSSVIRTSADGDYSPISTDSAGRVKTIVEGTADVRLTGSTVVLPTDKQAVLRTQHQSTTATLAGAATYTSTAEDVSTTPVIEGICFANQVGTLFVEGSLDNTNWDMSQSFTVLASTAKMFSVHVPMQYGRVRFLNGASAQGTFRLRSFRSVE